MQDNKRSKEMEMAIVVVTGRDGVVYDDPFYHGLFVSGDAATRWAYMNCKGLDWHWQPIAVTVTEDGEIAPQGCR